MQYLLGAETLYSRQLNYVLNIFAKKGEKQGDDKKMSTPDFKSNEIRDGFGAVLCRT